MRQRTRWNVILLILVMGGMLLSCRTGNYASGYTRKRSGIIPCPTVGEHKERKIFSRFFYQ
jgi:hypothetical protein